MHPRLFMMRQLGATRVTSITLWHVNKRTSMYYRVQQLVWIPMTTGSCFFFFVSLNTVGEYSIEESIREREKKIFKISGTPSSILLPQEVDDMSINPDKRVVFHAWSHVWHSCPAYRESGYYMLVCVPKKKIGNLSWQDERGKEREKMNLSARERFFFLYLKSLIHHPDRIFIFSLSLSLFLLGAWIGAPRTHISFVLHQ